MLLGTLINFIPFILFELRHNFLQIKSILKYINNFPTDGKLFDNFNSSINLIKGELGLTIFPDFGTHIANTHFIIIYIIILLICGIIYFWKKHIDRIKLFELVIWTIIPMLIFSFIQAKPWYIYGLIPVYTIFIAGIIRVLPKILKLSYLVIIIIGSFLYLNYSIRIEKKIELATRPELMINRLDVVKKVEEYAISLDYSVYYYLPEIYDHPYQYIYLWHGKMDRKLPVEFAYKPKAVAYADGKDMILKKFGLENQDNPKFTFYVLEHPQFNDSLIEDWWAVQSKGDLIKKQKIKKNVEIYQYLSINKVK